ncbi:MAG: hypothetical protein CBC35_09320 [Planctomycetes bacterium TMED75]|nr:hypothetical protein [Planctomycetaceae bacterium]OUU91549.1 MAG: hypothetical protein CBC35_09320 [Planctomycetes bacterium TMED75]
MITRIPSSLRLAIQQLCSLAVVLFALVGCEVDNYMDPSKTGYFEFAPTTIPVLERIDVIEEAELPFAEITQPTAEDLIPQSMEYRLAPSDVVRVEIYELLESNMNDISVLIVDQAGQIRIKTLGNIPAAGLTLEELKREIVNRVKATIDEPLVSVSLEQGRAYEYTIYGAVNGTGVYSISRDDFRVMDALALSGGTIASTMNIYVIRELPLTDLVKPEYNRGANRSPQGSAATQPRAPEPEPDRDNAIDIESLIQNLENAGGTSGRSSSPGMVSQDSQQMVDLDDVDSDPASSASAAPATQDGFRSAPGSGSTQSGGYRFDQEQEVWVPVGGGEQMQEMLLPIADDSPKRSFATRIIQVDYQRLARGDSDLNIIVRPGDRLYVEPPLTGVVYIDGEIGRPGVYQLPVSGKLTLSRLVAAAGGFGPIAIPERVDLTRVVGDGREATIRVNLSAIRNRTEPDIYMQPDDHVNIGTNFWAQPLAVVRNGFRASYGFGFLLDRNFGNDVFGPPPTNIGNFR